VSVNLRVAVIARPASTTLTSCLEALATAGVVAEVFRIGTDGPGMARNRALAGGECDVLALVEDDVAVGRDWCDGLRASWTMAADDIAVIGGPLRLRILGQRPTWLSSGVEGTLGVLDLGDRALDLDLGTRTLLGGNVSFRCDALRGAGGFWPARGHPDVRDWFSDEHHAQQALGELGWHGAYEPRLGAERLVPAAGLRARGLVRRRARYGARLAAVGGGRSKRTAARALVAATAGALLTRDPACAVERAARAAENLGALAGARAVARDFEPVAARTPFRPSVPPPARRQSSRARRRSSDGALILLYHRVADAAHDPLRLCVPPKLFGEQLDVLATARRVVSLEELAIEREPGSVAISFDDGYDDNATNAAPALAARRLPWTLFVSTGHVEERRCFWWDEVASLFAGASQNAPAQLRLEMPGGARAWRPATPATRVRVRQSLLAAMQGLSPDSITAAIAGLRAWARSEADTGAPRPMSVSELRDLARSGVSIGAHTRTHRGLAYASAHEQRADIWRSREDLERWLGRAPKGFAYPFGVPGADVDATTVRLVREAGFDFAVLNAPGLARPRSDAFALPRAAVPPVDGDAFARWLRGPAA
jgi:peptidoglycan/xylan/chitin deacetylase (PgdA/CDA1 family)